MKKWNLPDGWEWIELGKLCTLTGGGTPDRSNSSYFDGDIVWITPTDIVSSTLIPTIRDSKTKITDEGSRRSSAKLVKEGTVLFSSRATIGKIAIAGIPLATNQGFANFTCSDKLYNRYLAWALKALTENIKGLASSAVYLEINRTRFREFSIPIPYPDDPTRSLETQRRIVARLEALLAEVASARGLQDEIAKDTERVMEAFLAEIFPDPEKKSPDGWTVKFVEEISKNPQYGYTKSANKEKIGPKFLRITDIQDGLVDWEQVPYCQCDQAALKRYQLQDSDIVFARTGATTGKTFLIKNPPEAVFASYLIRLHIEKDVLPDFVYWFFQSPHYWRQIIPRGGAQPNMNAQLLKKVCIPIPTSIPVQEQIIARIAILQNELREMQKGQTETSLLITQLEQSFLAQAFRGEL